MHTKNEKSNYYALERNELLNLLPSQFNNLLDVGCGNGNFGALVKNKLNKEVWGIEPNENAAKEAEKKLDKVLEASFENAYKEINNTFDVICFNDVLEHLIDPWRALKMARSKLTEKGIIIASLPNFLHFYNIKEIVLKKDWKYTEMGILDRTHLRFFTRKSAIRLFTESGLHVKEVNGINPVKSKAVSLISLLSGGYFSEIRYAQFVIHGKKE